MQTLSRLPLSTGAIAPKFIVTNHHEQNVKYTYFTGKPLVLLFSGTDQRDATIEQLCLWRDLYAEIEALGGNVASITMDSVESRCEIAKKHNIPFFLMTDSQAEVSGAFGVCEPTTINGQKGLIFHREIFLIDYNWRILKIYDQVDPQSDALQIIAELKKLVSIEPPRQILLQAPVLLIPHVLDEDFCRKLINIWEHNGNSDSGFMMQIGDKTVGMYDYSHKIRNDHVLEEIEESQHVRNCISERVSREIWKAFNYNMNRCEDYKVVCYDSDRGGYFRPHRDNTTPGTAHRKFAMTINLNVGEYEGGYLRFPEYGPHLYKPETGSAVIFSCSLLHEVTDITSGRRFALTSFLYSDREESLRIENEHTIIPDVSREKNSPNS